MKFHWLDHQHTHRTGLLQLMPDGPKLAVAFALLAGTAVMPWRYTGWFVGIAVMLLLVVVSSGLSPVFLLKRLLLLSPFVLGVVLVNILQPALRGRAGTIIVRSVLCLLIVLVVSNTTPFSRVLRVLRRVRLPGLLITTLALMHRYLFVLADEAERMQRARASRTFVGGRRWHWRTVSALAGQLFVRASERAERIYDAMCARGWK